MHKLATIFKIILIVLGTVVTIVAVQTFSGNPCQVQNLLTNPAITHLGISFHGIKITSELARTATEQAHGLSDRPSLGELEGLLFVFDTDVVPAFWMQDMRFPIDIIWLTHDWRVVGVAKNFRPESFPATVEPPEPIRYALEVNAGLADQLNLQVGDRASVLAN